MMVSLAYLTTHDCDFPACGRSIFDNVSPNCSICTVRASRRVGATVDDADEEEEEEEGLVVLL